MERRLAVLGAGAWGSALAVHGARGLGARLWARRPAAVEALERTHQIPFLPGVSYPERLEVSSDLAQVMTHSDDLLLAVPSDAFSELLLAMKPYLSSRHTVIAATKGLDAQSGCFLHERFESQCPGIPYAVLSGPSFALEVAQGLPTAVVVASKTPSAFIPFIQGFAHGNFRLYGSEDVIGVQLGGVLKNVLAIAAGISDGLNCGHNARSALITRGVAEMLRLGHAVGARRETITGLSGLGDLVLTSTGGLSRNRRLGQLLGQGLALPAALKEIGQAVEGVKNAIWVCAMATEHRVEMPICGEVQEILSGQVSPKEAVERLLSRAFKNE